jgi:uncharacterized protein YoxC
MKNLKSYLIELTIITIGVLIALFVNNYKEDYQAREYQRASLKTIETEVEANYSELKDAMEKQNRLLDTVKKYSADHISLYSLFVKAGGFSAATLSNTGLEFYKRNQINSIDFKVMSTLVRMNQLSKIINSKEERLADYAYRNLLIDTKESKMIVSTYLRDVLGSEKQLKLTYQAYLTKHKVENE